MWKAIGSLAFGLVLLCSTAGADTNLSKQEHTNRLKKFLGTWEFFINIPGDKEGVKWYVLTKIKFDGHDDPFTMGSEAFSGGFVQVRTKTGDFTKLIPQGYDFAMSAWEGWKAGDKDMDVTCYTYVFNPSPYHSFFSDKMIQGEVEKSSGRMVQASDGGPGVHPNCSYYGGGNQGTFVGIQR